MSALFWLIPLLPGASALVLLLAGSRLPRRWPAIQAAASVLASFALSVGGLLHLVRGGGAAAGLSKTLLPWIVSGSLSTSIAFHFDPLAAVMAIVVTGVGFLIHVYSAGYMAGDKGLARYFAFLNLFTFFMLVLVLASDLILMFVGWEGVGLCSYLLIGSGSTGRRPPKPA
jgi:NADH-quinone oxidoreductase subunit L